MIRKFTTSFFLSLLLLGTSSCSSDKEETTEVTPAANTELTRSFTYSDGPTTETNAAEYNTANITSVVTLASGNINLLFSTGFPAGRDKVYFSMPQAQLQTDFKGTYTIKTLPNPATGQALFEYVFQREANAGSVLSSNTNTATGELVITAYNSKSQLISGTYQLRMNQVYDPTRYSINLADLRKCDIAISGKFENIRITKE